jgi:hypothetical protein
MKRTVIVGDVHGCIDELDALLRTVAFDARTDRLILAGDLVAKGPASGEVVKAARELGAEGVRGNHDDHLLKWRRDPSKVKLTHKDAAASLADADWEYLASLPLSLRLPELNTCVVHAGLVPGRPLEKQRALDLMNLRSITSEGDASYRVDGGVAWASLYAGPEQIVFGHDAIRGLQKYKHAIGLDTGCCYGHALTALLLPEHRIVQVKARRAYAEITHRPEF